jgi:hypothetical protein
MTNSKFILDGNELDKFCKTWIGSGDNNPEIVFIGLEFSSEAKTKESICSFFNEIKNLNYPEIIAEYNAFVSLHTRKWDKYFDFNTSKIGAKNTTRHRMCLMAYSIFKKIKVDKNIAQTKDFKIFENKFANDESNTAALELYPLPCENEKDFKYKTEDWVDTDLYSQFTDKSTYKEYYLNTRKKLIKKYLENPKIKFLIFYSVSHKKDYEEICDIKFEKKLMFNNKKSYYIKKTNNKIIILIEHFSSFGYSYDYINNVIGNALNSSISNSQ